jgi:acyl carrier protein
MTRGFDVLDEMRRIARAELGVELGERGTPLVELGLDSLQRITLAVALEDYFCVRLDDLDGVEGLTLGELAEEIAQRVPAPHPEPAR